MTAPPDGVVTLVFTDIEGSSALWDALGDGMVGLLRVHDAVMRRAIERHRGYEVNTAGDSFLVAFSEASEAIAFCIEVQQQLARQDWAVLDALAGYDSAPSSGVAGGLRVRMGVHTGRPWVRRDPTTRRMDYGGPMCNRAARVSSAAHGGQVLVSEPAWAAAKAHLGDDVHVTDLGHHALRGLDRSEHIRQALPRALAERTFPPIRAVAEHRTNLRERDDSFVGREKELTDLNQRLVSGARLITVLGPGGTGKTRLTQQIARNQVATWSGGAWFCDLTEARTLDGVAVAVAQAFDVALTGSDPIAQVGDVLSRRRDVLVVLDNFEQVVQFAAESVARWRAMAPDVRFLVTSRSLLDIAGEEVFSLGPLSPSAALTLFEDRAASVRPGFRIDDTNRPTVAEIVERLDRMSLAIELAAARARVMAPDKLLKRLSKRFALLAGRRRDLTARQATLRGAIDWSWDLLRLWEQLALAQCSVFRGGFRLETAEEVLDLDAWPDAPWPMDVVQSLVDQSLLQLREPRAGHERVTMYESIREYAAEKLAEHRAISPPSGGPATGPDAIGAMRRRHAAHFATAGSDAFAESLCAHGGVELRWQLTYDLENLAGGVEAALADGDLELAAGCALGAAPVFEVRGPFLVGVKMLAGVRSRPGLSGASERRLDYWLGLLNRFGGRPDDARRHLEASLASNRAAGDRRGEGILIAAVGIADREQGRTDQARAAFVDALAIHREVGNRRGEGIVQGSIGLMHYDRGEVEDALRCYNASVAIHREVGDRRLEGRMLGNLGLVYRENGDIGGARSNYELALAISREVGDRLSEGITLGNLGDLAIEQDDWVRAEELLKRAVPICDETLPVAAGAFRGSLALTCSQRGNIDQARQLLAAGAAQLRGVHRVELGKLLCKQGLVEARVGAQDAAESALAEAEVIADESGVGADSALGTAISRLKRRLLSGSTR